jgi:hypothetical protein
MSDGQIAINTEATSPGLFFKSASGSLVKVGPVHVGTTAPNASPASGGETGNTLGEQWLDTTGGTYVFKVWDGSAWRSETGTFVDVNGDTMTGALGIIAGSVSTPGLFFSGDTNTGIYSPGADQVAISTAGSGRLFVDPNGIVSVVGTATTNINFTVNGAASSSTSRNWNFPGLLLRRTASNTTSAKQISFLLDGDTENDTTLTNYLNIWGTYSGTPTTSSTSTGLSASMNLGAPNAFIAHTNGNERLRIDSSGRLLVGTSTARANLFNATISPGLQLEAAGSLTSPNRIISVVNNFATNGDGGGVLALCRSKGGTLTSNTLVTSGDQLGRFDFQGNDGTQFVSGAMIEAYVDGTSGADDMPGRLVFSTTADGASSPTERMRITNGGSVLVNGVVSGRFAAVEDAAVSTSVVRGFANNASYTGDIVFAQSAAASGTGWNLMIGYAGTSTAVYKVIGNGNVQNTNNSYGAISDIKLKENIVDATSQWSDIKALQVRKYNFKEGQTHTQIGLVAQEVELVSPGLVTESPDRDEDGNDLGTVTKSVNYSVLYMKAVKALQEAMERIEVLEQRLNDAGIN